MGFRIVSHLITHARLEDKCAAIFQFRVQFALKAKQYVSLAAPMVSEITLRVFDHANADVAEMLRAPVAVPLSPSCLVWSMLDQSVVPNGMLDMSMIFP